MRSCRVPAVTLFPVPACCAGRGEEELGTKDEAEPGERPGEEGQCGFFVLPFSHHPNLFYLAINWFSQVTSALPMTVAGK